MAGNRLPISTVEKQIKRGIRDNNVLIIGGETGSGKSTKIPQFIYKEGLLGSRKLAISEPRRVAAITLAKRVSEEMNCLLGRTVGYKVRFESVVSDETKIIYGTDGIFLREEFHGNLFSQYSVFIVDEVHERSVHTDVLLYLLKKAFKSRCSTSNPLKVIIMSATADTELISKYFEDAPTFMIPGRNFNIDIYYGNIKLNAKDDYLFNALVTLMQIHRTEPTSEGVLVFLCGQEEIEIACKKAMESSQAIGGKMIALPLYSGLPQHSQLKVFDQPPQGTRKVIFATNVAETSLTIPGIRIIIDCGKVKTKRYFADRRIDVLHVEDVSRASAIQRAGRAGRESDGKCYRLYSEAHFENLSPSTEPEMCRMNLSSVIIELLSIGVRDIRPHLFISPPKAEAIASANLFLKLLGATEETTDYQGRFQRQLTHRGRIMAAFPVDPVLSRILVAAHEYGCLEEALTIVSFLSTDTVFLTYLTEKEHSIGYHSKFSAPEGDHFAMLKVFKFYRGAKKNKHAKTWCEENFLNERVLNTVFKIRRQLRQICIKQKMEPCSFGEDSNKLSKALCKGFLFNACRYERMTDSYRSLFLPDLTSLKIHPTSFLARKRPNTVIYSHLVETNQLYMRDLTVISDDWVKGITP